jgi:hypothetical protein
MDTTREPMAEKPAEPGWWLASDGQWYPPEAAPSKWATQVDVRPSTRPQPPAPDAQQQWQWQPTPPGPVGGYPAYGYAASPTRSDSGVGVAAMVVGIIALCLFWTVTLGILLGLVALGLGIAARVSAGTSGNRTGKATGGIVLGSISIVLSIFVVIVWGALLTSAFHSLAGKSVDPVKYKAVVTSCAATRPPAGVPGYNVAAEGTIKNAGSSTHSFTIYVEVLNQQGTRIDSTTASAQQLPAGETARWHASFPLAAGVGSPRCNVTGVRQFSN